MSRMLRQFLEDGTGEAVEDGKPNDLQFFNQHENQLAMVMGKFIAAIKNVSPVRENSALTRSQAAGLLACLEASVSKYISLLRRGVNRWCDMKRYLETGIHTGRSKQYFAGIHRRPGNCQHQGEESPRC